MQSGHKLCILSRVDYCNSILACYPQIVIKPLQQIQNSAAKHTLKSLRAEHTKHLLKQMHWLPIEERSKYKIACLCYQIITGTTTKYLAELIQIYVPSMSLRTSSDKGNFASPPSKENSMVVVPFASQLHIIHPEFSSLRSPSPPFSPYPKTSQEMYLFKQYFDQ